MNKAARTFLMTLYLGKKVRDLMPQVWWKSAGLFIDDEGLKERGLAEFLLYVKNSVRIYNSYA